MVAIATDEKISLGFLKSPEGIIGGASYPQFPLAIIRRRLKIMLVPCCAGHNLSIVGVAGNFFWPLRATKGIKP